MNKMERLKEVISTVAMKGGTGKTTTVISLAGALLHCNKNLRILIIDLDAQGNISTLLGWSQKPGCRTLYEALRDKSSLPVYETTIKSDNGKGGVFLVPYNPLLSSVQIELSRSMQPKVVLRKCFGKALDDNTGMSLPDDITEAFDYVLLDCPPALNDITFNAMSVSDSVIIPVQAERLAMDGLVVAMKAFEEFKEELKPDMQLKGILFTMLNERTSATKSLSKIVSENYKEQVLDVRIHRCTKVVEAQAMGQNLYEYAPTCTTAIDYLNLAKKIINDNKKGKK